jgi:hypothetical protein
MTAVLTSPRPCRESNGRPFNEGSHDPTQVHELLLQSLEHERGGVKIYKAAISCARREDLRDEWSKYLAQTEQHVIALIRICEVFGLDPFATTPGTMIVRATGNALVQSMEAALSAGNPGAAQIVAAECVVLAETKDHLDWELLGEVAKELSGREQEVVRRTNVSRMRKTSILSRKAVVRRGIWSRCELRRRRKVDVTTAASTARRKRVSRGTIAKKNPRPQNATYPFESRRLFVRKSRRNPARSRPDPPWWPIGKSIFWPERADRKMAPSATLAAMPNPPRPGRQRRANHRRVACRRATRGHRPHSPDQSTAKVGRRASHRFHAANGRRRVRRIPEIRVCPLRTTEL